MYRPIQNLLFCFFQSEKIHRFQNDVFINTELINNKINENECSKISVMHKSNMQMQDLFKLNNAILFNFLGCSCVVVIKFTYFRLMMGHIVLLRYNTVVAIIYLFLNLIAF